MGMVKYFSLTATILFAASISCSQCCCSGVYFTLLDKHNSPIAADKLAIKDLTPNILSRSLSLSLEIDVPDIRYHLYCGQGNEVVAVTYKSKVMQLHFKFSGDFGIGRGSFKFASGDFFVDPLPRTGQSPNLGMKLRKASLDELRIRD